MKEVSFYECEFCGETFRTKTDAIEHEKTHKELIGINETVYGKRTKFPYGIEIQFKLGEKKTTAEDYYHKDFVYKAIELARSREWANFDDFRVSWETEKLFKQGVAKNG